ncbi:PAS domain S-box protein [uncultured Polaribacter sp.]|uniref:PAS domain-containing sensor histidine kinase n=1 Tax=uncultured Polaribacter sp. TaxID=174711 RepID=UPI003704177D
MGKSSYEELEKELKELKNSDIRPLKKDHYENLFDNMSEMVEVIELIYDKNNQPIDFYIRAINTSLAKFLGKTKKQLINKKISSIVDRIEENWFTYFAKVDKTGEPLRFKNYGVAFDKYYFVSVWKVSKKTVGVSFTDITKTEKDKIKLNKKLENETKVRTEAEFLVKNGKLELHQTINSLDTAQKQIIYQNKTKGENSWELRRIKAELEQQSFYLNKVAIVSETDADFNILFVNDNFCEIYGYPREELIGQNHRILKSGKQPEAFFTDMITTIVSGGVFKGEVLNKRNGTEEYYWMDLTIMPFKDLNGKIIRFVAIMFDITDQYKQKEILLNQADELVLANKELAFQNEEKGKRADELVLANKELAFQNEEKGKRADELVLANKELAFQNEEKGKRADELAIAKKELIFQKELDSYRSEAERVAHELTLLIDTANAPIFGIDSKGLVNEWNQTSEKITGFKKDEVLGKKLVQTYITKDYRKSVKKVLDDALLGKETANYEFPLFSKDGERVMVLLNSSSRRDANGKITGVLGVGQDISEMDKLRTVSESIAKELRQFIETANAPIFGIDSKGLVNEWNQTSEKITGFKKDEVLGKNLVQTYITEDYRESVKKVLDDALRGKETANYEFPLFTKSGERVMVLLNSSSRRDANGKITGVLGVGQDITELVGYRNELEIKVEERTIKLNQALEKQKELNELKSKFVSTASHEFRTPLSAINFAAGSIKKYWGKMEPVMVEKKLHKIEDQVMHMTRLLDDVLVIGQAGAGKTRNNPLNMPLGNFINEIIEEVYTSHKKSNKIVVIDTENIKNETIFIDEKLGRNIFINLISNAVKYSKNKENVTITFSSEKDFIIVTVTDSGIGISKSELKTIFTPFSRGEHVDLIQGTGLGLSIAKEAIDAIGGEIIVSSKIGLGATFKVKVPKNKNNV